MDASAYFDSISHVTLRRTLEHARFPPQLLDLLCNFYSHSERIFNFSGACSNQWTKTSIGIPQGCPLSPMLSAAIARVWRCYCTGSQGQGKVSALAYIDDRTIWLRRDHDLAAGRSATRTFEKRLRDEAIATGPRYCYGRYFPKL